MLLPRPADQLSSSAEPAAADATGMAPGYRPPIRRRAHAAAKALLGINDGDLKGSPWRAVTLPRFRLYFAASSVSNFGTWLQNAAQVVLVFDITRSVFWVGLVSCGQFASPLLLGPCAGALTGRFGNWRTLIVTQFSSLVISAILAGLDFTGALTMPWLIAGAIGLGLAYTFALPAVSITIPELVPPDQTKKALAMDSVSYNLGRALAPVLSVVVFMNVGFGPAFALNAASFGFFAGVLLWLRPHQAEAAILPARTREGMFTACRDRTIIVLLLMVAAITVAADPILVLGPSLARSFGHSAAWSGLFITALGAGNVMGSLRRSRQKASLRRAAWALCALGIAMMFFVAAPSIWISAAAALMAGMACLVAGATLKALLWQRATASRQAAVMAAWMIAWAGSKPIASLLDGALAGSLGLKWAGVLLALPAVIPLIIVVACPAKGKRLVRHVGVNLAGLPEEAHQKHLKRQPP
jgi:MFS family permease